MARPETTSLVDDRRTQRSRQRWLLAIGPATVVLLVGTLALDGVRRARTTRELVAHTRDVMARAQGTLSTLQDAETGQRGYLLTGDGMYLEPHRSATSALQADTIALRMLTRDNIEQQRRLDTLGTLLHAKMGEMASTITLMHEGEAEKARAEVRTNEGKQSMDGIRLLLSTLTSTERALLEKRQADEASRERVLTVILVAGTLLSMTFALLVNRTLLQHAAVEAAHARELEAHNTLLEEQAVELELQTTQLQDQTAELEMQTEELQTMNEELEAQTVEAQAARESADNASQAKSEFLAMMSHELRTPLNAIGGYAQLMQLGIPAPVPAEHQEYLTRIQESQVHLMGIITSVLNFARLEAGAVGYDIRDIQVAEVLASAEPLVRPLAAAREHTYVQHAFDESLLVRTDRQKAAQILVNLLSNAVKFTQPGGRIHVSVMSTAESVKISVTDTGIGVPADWREAVFEPFVQVDTSLSGEARGTGLGLAISRNLAHAMGGDISHADAPEGGSIFTITLPRATG